MTIKRVFMVALSGLLLLTLAVPAWADHGSGKKIKVSGVIVSLHPQAASFLLQQRRRAGDRLWVVQIDGRTKIELEDDDDDDDAKDHPRAGFRVIDVGDVVRVEGRAVGSQQILAREIEIIGHVRGPISAGPATFPQPFPPFPQPPFPFPQPPGTPFSFAPEILSPRNGAEIVTSEFTIIGRAFPGAQVHIGVLAQFGLFRTSIASADVVADNAGLFTHTVRPSVRLPGAMYTITVTARFQGAVSPPTSIVVRQL